MRKMFALVCAVGVAGFAVSAEPQKDEACPKAQSEVATFIARQEKIVADRVAAEKEPLRKLQMEYLQRQDASARMAEELRRAVMTEAFTSPEVERLRAERKNLQKQLAAVREALIAAGYETDGAKEMKAAMETNEARIAELQRILWPKTGIAPKSAPKDVSPDKTGSAE